MLIQPWMGLAMHQIVGTANEVGGVVRLVSPTPSGGVGFGSSFILLNSPLCSWGACLPEMPEISGTDACLFSI